MKIRGIIFLLVIIFCSSLVSATTYYVSTTSCSDSYQGTLSQPWCTITKAAAVLQAGDTVLVADGTYNIHQLSPTNKGTSTNPITFKANGNNVIIKDTSSSYQYAFWLNSGDDFITIDGFKFQNVRTAVYARCSIANDYCEGVKFINNVVDSPTLEALYLEPENLGIKDWLIENNVVNNGGLGGPQKGVNVIIRNNVVNIPSGTSASCCSGSYTSGLTIENNKFYCPNCLGHCMGLSGSSNIQVKNNLIYGWEDSAYFWNCANINVLHNTRVGTSPTEAGFQFDGSCTNVIHKDNLYSMISAVPGAVGCLAWTPALSQLTSNNNLFFLTSSHVLVECYSCGTRHNYQLPSWRSASGNKDANSIEVEGHLESELFVNPSALDFRPKTGTWPCNAASDGTDIGALPCSGTQQPQVCTLANGYWSESNIVNGTQVHLIVQGTNCNNKQINFTIYDKDYFNLDDFVTSVVSNYDRTTWTAIWQIDELLMNPEYYFVAFPVENPNSIVTSGYLNVTSSTPLCTDIDGDGYGNPASSFCIYPGLDCNDNNVNINPGVTEVCNDNIDNDCDGLIDINDPYCQHCSGTDTSCGVYPNCANCNLQDGCNGNFNRDYYCSSNSCAYTEDNCNDCSCSCNGYNQAERISNNNCNDNIDNDCDGLIDVNESECQTTGTNCVYRALEGFGITSGGQGKTTYHVTSLADSGTGTLRDALSQGNRNIVFDLGGTIYLNSPISVSSSFITIDGSNAPNPGITIKSSGASDLLKLTSSNCHDIIIKNIRFRNAPNDNIQITNNAYNIIIDRCSSTGATDGNLDIGYGGNVHDVTVQWSIIGANYKNSLISASDVGVNSKNIALHHNLYITGQTRNPKLVIDNTGIFHFVNNVVFDWLGSGTEIDAYSKGNLIANYYLPGPTTTPSKYGRAIKIGDGYGAGYYGQLYMQGNVIPAENDPYFVGFTTNTIFNAPTITTYNAQEAFSLVKNEAGACPRDSVDTNYLSILPDIQPIILCVDNDNDRYNQSQLGCGIADCNDNNVNINPGVDEDCDNNIDDDCDGVIDCGNTINITSFNLTLINGNNYVSFPLLDEEKSVEYVFGSGYNYLSKIYYHDPSLGWVTYVKGRTSSSNLMTIKPKRSYIVKMTSNYLLETKGIDYGGQITLNPGWNMIGISGTESILISEALQNVNYLSVWKVTGMKRTQQAKLNPSTDYFEPGKAYWVYVNVQSQYSKPFNFFEGFITFIKSALGENKIPPIIPDET